MFTHFILSTHPLGLNGNALCIFEHALKFEILQQRTSEGKHTFFPSLSPKPFVIYWHSCFSRSFHVNLRIRPIIIIQSTYYFVILLADLGHSPSRACA